MILYATVTAVLLFIVPEINKSKKTKRGTNNNWVMLIAFVITYILLCGLRDGGGHDDEMYKLYYNSNYGGSIFSFLQEKEPLFNIIRQAGYELGVNYKFMFLCYALITSIFIAAALKNYFENDDGIDLYIAAMFFLVYTSLFTVMRQAVGMAIIFYLYSCENLSWKKRVLLWFAILCSHTGFIVMLPIEFLITFTKYKINNKILIIVPIVCLILGRSVDLNRIIEFVTSKTGLFEYMNRESNFNQESNIGVVAYSLFAVYLINMMRINTIRSHNSDLSERMVKLNDGLLWGQMMYFSILFLTSTLRWGNRIGYYYMLFAPFVLFNFLKLFALRPKEIFLIRKIMIAVLYVFFLFTVYFFLGKEGYQWSLNMFS